MHTKVQPKTTQGTRSVIIEQAHEAAGDGDEGWWCGEGAGLSGGAVTS